MKYEEFKKYENIKATCVKCGFNVYWNQETKKFVCSTLSALLDKRCYE